MPKKTGTAPEFILRLLRQYPDNEMQVADFYRESGEGFSKANLTNALTRLLQEGLVERTVDPDRSAWWAITEAGKTAPWPPVTEKAAAPKADQPSVPAVEAEKDNAAADTETSEAPSTSEEPAPAAPRPATPAGMTEATKQFVLDALRDAGQPLTTLDILGRRERGDKHVSMRTLKLATYYLGLEGKVEEKDVEGRTVLVLVSPE